MEKVESKTATFVVVQFCTEPGGEWMDTEGGTFSPANYTDGGMAAAKAHRAWFDQNIPDADATRIVARTITELVID